MIPFDHRCWLINIFWSFQIWKYPIYIIDIYEKLQEKLNKVRDVHKVLREFRGHVSAGFRGLRSLIMPVDVPMIDGENFGGKISRWKTFARPTSIYFSTLSRNVFVVRAVSNLSPLFERRLTNRQSEGKCSTLIINCSFINLRLINWFFGGRFSNRKCL